MNLPSIRDIKSEMIFKNLTQIEIENKNINDLIIRNSVVIDCKFKNVEMTNADLLTSKFSSTKFINVNFISADIFSIWFSNCEFINVDFTGAGIEDITFINCKFENCIFKDVSLKNCIFTDCMLTSIKPSSCTFSLNVYKGCSFDNCLFKGSFQYQIFNKCHFQNVLMDSLLLEYNFGLGIVAGLEYIYNGENKYGSVELKELLINKCYKQNLFLNAVLVSYNFDKINPILLLDTLVAIKKMLNNDILIRNDEIIFLKSLFHFLYVQHLIAPIVLYKMFENVKKIYLNPIDNTSFSKCRETLYMIANGLYFDFSEFCNQLQDNINQTPNYIAPINIIIHYEKEPQIMISSILNHYTPDLFKRTLTKKGSFIEYLEAGQNGLEIFKIFIQILGISVPIIYSEVKEKRKKTESTHIKKDVNIVATLQNSDKNTSELINQTCQMINSSDILNENLQGYNNNNIKEIKIEYHVEIQT